MIGNVYVIKNGWSHGLRLTIVGLDGPFFILKEFGKENKPGPVAKKTRKEIDRMLILDPKATLKNKLNSSFGS